MTLERWLRLMQAWGFARNDETFEALVRAYSGRHRHYHGIEHIEACLRHLDECRAGTTHPQEVELALWFHDAIYEPLAGGNERRSADWAAQFLAANGASREAVARVHALILSTEHGAPARTADEALLLDIDLSILGTGPETYDVFESGVRQEYRLVPAPVYRRKRSEVLQGFLDRPHIYRTETFRTRYERQARENLARAISRLARPG